VPVPDAVALLLVAVAATITFVVAALAVYVVVEAEKVGLRLRAVESLALSVRAERVASVEAVLEPLCVRVKVPLSVRPQAAQAYEYVPVIVELLIVPLRVIVNDAVVGVSVESLSTPVTLIVISLSLNE